MNEAVKALRKAVKKWTEYHDLGEGDYDNGLGDGLRGCARALDPLVTLAEREMAALREPGPCGKHPLACYKWRRVGMCDEQFCTACTELAVLQSRIDRARKLAPKWRKDAETSSIGIYLNECADEIEAVLDRKESA